MTHYDSALIHPASITITNNYFDYFICFILILFIILIIMNLLYKKK